MTFYWNWFLNGFSLIVIAIICFYSFFVCRKKIKCSNIGKIFGINGLIFFVYGILNFLWFFEKIKPIESDFILIGSMFNIMKASFFIILIYNLFRDKNLLYILFLFLITALATPGDAIMFFLIVSIVSYCIIAISSFDLFIINNKNIKKAGILVLTYSITSIMLLIFIFSGRSPSSMIWFVPNFVYALVFIIFLSNINKIEEQIDRPLPKVKSKKKIFWPLLFLKFMIFVIAIISFMLLSTVVIHELGHSFAAQYYGCEKTKAVIYDTASQPHTEIVCEGYYNDKIITLSGILLPIIVGMIFIFSGGSFTTNLAYLIFGFSLIIASKDFEMIGMSRSWIFIMTVLGAFILVYGISRLSIDYVKQKGSLFESEEYKLEKSICKDCNERIKKIDTDKKTKIK